MLFVNSQTNDNSLLNRKMNYFRGSIFAFFSIAILLSCRTESKKVVKLRIVSLSPYHFSFSSHNKDFYGNVNDYYFLDDDVSIDSVMAVRLLKWLPLVGLKDERTHYHSIYIYNKTDVLNRNFNGNKDDLKGSHDNDLRAYVRFTQNKLDILYLIKDGKVTYDGVKKEVLGDPFDFD